MASSDRMSGCKALATVYIDHRCCAGRGGEFHKQWQWLFLADASVCEACQAGEQPWLLAVKYTFTGKTIH